MKRFETMLRFFVRMGLISALLIGFASDWLHPAPVLAVLGWVGNMSPAPGSETSLTSGGSLVVSVEVWKSGVTDSSGQGASIACYVRRSVVPYWSGPQTTSDLPMAYSGDVGSNDEYSLTLTPEVGLYEYKAFCRDLTDNDEEWPSGADARLIVRTASGSCNTAVQSDNNIYHSGLLHDSFAVAYRDPVGPVSTDQPTVALKLRTCMNDLNAVPQIRIWDDLTNTAITPTLTFDGHGDGGDAGSVTYWRYDVGVPASPTILYYVFRTVDGTATAYYRDDDPKFYGGGYGAAEGDQNVAYDNSYQITVYDPAFAVPEWMQGGVVYQVFPDRFRDGNPANNPEAGRFSYNTSGTIVRSNDAEGDWNTEICDPRVSSTPCTDKYGDNFYGGDLAGITEKIEVGYFDALGVSVLYLNPIFLSPSNHKYDTADYMLIDPDFGTPDDFHALTAAAHAHGMKVILDGVFNHTSSDSVYFDRFKRFDTNDVLTSTVEGDDDNRGACESPGSPYRNWFYIPAAGSPATGVSDRCDGNDADDPGGAWDQTYTAWWGYGSLPKLRSDNTAVRALIWSNGTNSVGPYWVSQGADGWRFDVGDDVDPGLTVDSSNDYWEGFRGAVRTVQPDTLMLGEVWGDASALLLGNEWDSVMNYRFRSAVLGWLFTGCSDDGCTGGHTFEDNDNNAGSSGGAISTLSPSLFNARLRAIEEDYPPMAWQAMMNLEGSHDTNRLRFLLKKINNNNDSAALQRMKEWWLFAFTYAGSPTLYYGDEVALNHDGVWANNKWEDDPYNRAPYPWPDTPGAYAADLETLAFARKMASIRWSYPALQSGAVQHGIVIDDANQLYGFARTGGSQTALIVLNRGSITQTVNLTGLGAAPYNLSDGTALYDAIEGNPYTVSGGSVSVPVNPTWGVVLLEQIEIQTPAMPVVTYTENTSPEFDVVSWPVVFTDTTGGRELVTSYAVYSGTTSDFIPSAGNRIGTVAPPDSGTPNGMLTFTTTNPAKGTYYKVCAYNAAGKSSCGAYGPTAVTLVNVRPLPLLWWCGALLTFAAGMLAYRRRGHRARGAGR